MQLKPKETIPTNSIPDHKTKLNKATKKLKQLLHEENNRIWDDKIYKKSIIVKVLKNKQNSALSALSINNKKATTDKEKTNLFA